MLTQEDLELLDKKGISREKLEEQLDCFRKGFPYLRVDSAATLTKGIVAVASEKKAYYIGEWQNYLKEEHEIVKFVPASGAASRMFKSLFEFIEKNCDELSTEFEKMFFDNLESFAFFDKLNECCKKNTGKSAIDLKKDGRYLDIVRNILNKEGLNYAVLPKGLLQFHKYPKDARTPFEEHLVEGALYAKNRKGQVNLHFTVSPEHLHPFELLLEDKRASFSYNYGAEFDVSFSVQKTSTDTVAVDAENNPFRVNDRLFFRPGGHGALIENLNDIDADVVFIKNIDNVVPDPMKQPTVEFKAILAGVLVNVQKKIFSYLELMDKKTPGSKEIDEMLRFCETQLCLDDCGTAKNDPVSYLRTKMNRPLRVCGMVRNQGEPGGGPFVCFNADGTKSLQILESSQFDKNDAGQMEIAKNATHFNPVDLVCAVKDYKGGKFDLTKYVDYSTGFISSKSKDGKELKALELPGLWNGAMSDWNTVFVEVPIETFNPVKTVGDLLRKEHQM